MNILIWAVLILMAVEIIAMPAVFGKERTPYGYKVWFSSIITAAMITPICLRALGIV